MNSRRVLTVLMRLLAIGAVVAATARLTPSRQGRPADAAPAASETVRFLRNPTSVSAFSVRDLDGHPVSSSEWAGKVVLVNFWATWCPPCRAEIPDLVALQKKYRKELQIIGISEDDGSPELVKQFAAEHKINYPVAMVTPEIERIFAGVSSLPTSFLIDRDGRIVQKHLGILSAATDPMHPARLSCTRR